MFAFPTIIAKLLALMLWCVNSAAALKCYGYWLDCLLAEHLRQRQCSQEGGLICECTGKCTWKGLYSVGECRKGGQFFLIYH